MDQNEIDKKKREVLRWRIIQTLNIGRPLPLGEDTILQTVSGLDMSATQTDLRRELDYLELRKLVTIDGRGVAPQWTASLTRYGVDLAEYEIECEAGIARPQRYW